MSNFDKASKLASEWVESMGGLDNISYRYGDDVSGLMQALEAAGLLMSDVQVIRTPEDLEALAREDSDAVVLAGFAGVPRPSCTLYEMYKAGQEWTLPAVIIATGTQARAAREAMEQEHG